MLLDNYHPSESSGTEADLYGLEKDNSDDEGAEDAGSDSRKATPGDDNSSDAEEDVNHDSDESDPIPIVPTKRKAKAKPEGKTKTTGPRAGTSAPAPAPAKKSKKVASSMDRFATISVAEEATEQKKLDLRKVKIMKEKDVEIESTKARASVQIRKEELKAELAMTKLRFEHEKHMAELQARNHGGFQTFPHSSSTLQHHGAPHSHSGPFTYHPPDQYQAAPHGFPLNPSPEFGSHKPAARDTAPEPVPTQPPEQGNFIFDGSDVNPSQIDHFAFTPNARFEGDP